MPKSLGNAFHKRGPAMRTVNWRRFNLWPKYSRNLSNQQRTESRPREHNHQADSKKK